MSLKYGTIQTFPLSKRQTQDDIFLYGGSMLFS